MGLVVRLEAAKRRLGKKETLAEQSAYTRFKRAGESKIRQPCDVMLGRRRTSKSVEESKGNKNCQPATSNNLWEQVTKLRDAPKK
jgi:hypothetical protein